MLLLLPDGMLQHCIFTVSTSRVLRHVLRKIKKMPDLSIDRMVLSALYLRTITVIKVLLITARKVIPPLLWSLSNSDRHRSAVLYLACRYESVHHYNCSGRVTPAQATTRILSLGSFITLKPNMEPGLSDVIANIELSMEWRNRCQLYLKEIENIKDVKDNGDSELERVLCEYKTACVSDIEKELATLREQLLKISDKNACLTQQLENLDKKHRQMNEIAAKNLQLVIKLCNGYQYWKTKYESAIEQIRMGSKGPQRNNDNTFAVSKAKKARTVKPKTTNPPQEVHRELYSMPLIN